MFGPDQDGNEKLQLPAQEVKVNTGAAVISHRHFNRCRPSAHGWWGDGEDGGGAGAQWLERGRCFRCQRVISKVFQRHFT